MAEPSTTSAPLQSVASAEPGEPLEVTRLNERFPDAIVEFAESNGHLRITVKRDRVPEVLQFLRDDSDMAFSFFSECLGVDYKDLKANGLILGKANRFEVVYNLYSMPNSRTGAGRKRRIFLKVQVPESDPVVPTVTGVYPGANFPEREVFDMFGIRFKGHPDLRRILMSDDWVGHPQRKDYPLGGERVQFPGNKYGPSVGDGVVQHAGESFFGRTASDLGDSG